MMFPSSLKPLLILGCLVPVFARAQAAPASAPAPATAAIDAPDFAALEVTITGVEGMVQVRDGEDQPWRKCAPGMTVGAGTHVGKKVVLTDTVRELIGDDLGVLLAGLQYTGNGSWHFNWKTPKSYANQCRIMTVTLNDGSTRDADFKFK